ncbi:class I SAM-dependent methyltransferase [uncultured Sphingomonas sp.]|uniref:class I SAM-dependent methyltransferase n=1 Tax=uncultured Sphingomonas sp. TaxID=158754 RepID=UPI0026073B1C|nr:class I SAM-dependent methyltransferase [uncultured Sphingomonas sp.]
MASEQSFRTRLLNRAGWEISKINDRFQDWRLGIDTIDRLRSTHEADLRSKFRPNEGTSYRALNLIARSFVVRDDDALVDIGCGFGRAICYFAYRGAGRKFVGIELRPDDAEQARRNASKIDGVPISIITGDATEQQYSDASAFYIYNPFDGEVMRRTLARIHAQQTRDIRICYVNPVERSIFEAAGWLEQVHSSFVPYRSGKTEVTIWHSR